MFNRKCFVGLVVLLVVLIAAQYAVLGAYKLIKLKPGSALAGVTEQSLVNSSGNFPTDGKDFNLKDIRYFDGGQWAVASIAPIDNRFNSGTIILKKDGGSYMVVAGPSPIFSRSYVYVVPSEVAQDLNRRGVLNESL